MKEVVGFYPSWSASDTYLSLNYNTLSTISWAALGVNSDGSLVKQNYPPSNLISYAHSKGKKVIVSVNPGWGSSTIDTILASTSVQSTLINNLLSEVATNGFDGVDIDLEGFQTTNSVNGQSNRTLFTNFMQSLSSAFGGYYISIDLPAVDWNTTFDTVTLQNYVNRFMIMGYDFHWETGPTAGAVAPLTAPSGISVTDSVNTYLQTIPSSKLLLGVPYYGYEWQTQTQEPESATIGAGTTLTYNDAVTRASTYGRKWDAVWSCPYYLTGTGQGWYDDDYSLGLKYDLVNQKNLAGIGIWALGYDSPRTELSNMIINKFGSVGGGSVGIPLTQNKILLAAIGGLVLILLLD